MTATLQPETKSTSRRAMLAGALGGIGALAATAIGRASPVRGADLEAVVVGGDYSADSPTGFVRATGVTLYGSSGSGWGLQGLSTSGTGVHGVSSGGTGVQGVSTSGTGVHGVSSGGTGVHGNSDSGAAVVGTSTSGIGVNANSSTYIGVSGSNSAPDQPASLGWSFGNSTGVLGVSGGPLPTAKAKTGVYGYANQDNTSSAVYGLSPLGVAIRGHTASGYAGYFEGRVYTNAFYELGEVATPAAPLANRARLFVRDNGAGKTQLCVRFRTGAVRVLSTEP